MKHPCAPSSSTRVLRASVLGAAAGLLLGACESGTASRNEAPDGFADIGDIQLQLTRAADCGDLLTKIQDGMIAQLGQRAKELRSEEFNYGVPQAGGVTVGEGNAVSDPAAPPRDAPTPVPGVSPEVEVAEDTASDNGSDGDGAAPQGPAGEESGGFSGTTRQVADVDEADIIKTDGDFMYLLHGASLFVLRAWPAASTEVVASTTIEGEPVEMFVRDGKAVIFSRVYRDLAVESGGAATPAYDYYYGGTSYTKLTVLDVGGAAPSVLRESYVEGDYISARRHDGIVRAVVQDGFKVPPLGNANIQYRDPFGQPYPQADIDAQVDAWLERTIRSIRATELGDWLPREFTVSNSTPVLEAPRCADYYAPEPGLAESGVTSVVALDLEDPAQALAGATILGRAERVYSNQDVVLVTQSDYRFEWSAEAREQTIIHRFDIAGPSTAYTASGAIAGTIHNQFSLDERDGIIAVSTTERSWGGRAVPGIAIEPARELDADVALAPAPEPVMPEGPINRIVTLETQGTSLEQLGATAGFGQNEQIFATRFMGDRAYVVTFRQTDPLFVVDMSDPRRPEVVGELHIPGFSNYLFPLGQDHLFAIGRDATSEGITQGLALQIFDVSNPTAPALAHRHVFADLGDSPANVDHRAITFHADRDVVAFPHQNWQTGESTLEVFRISAASGFLRLGGMGMPENTDLEQCLLTMGYGPADIEEILPQVENDLAWQREVLVSCSYGRQFRRGVFRDDVVYGISTTGVYAYSLDAMDAGALGQVSLPAPVYDYGQYGGGASPGRPAMTPPPQPSEEPAEEIISDPAMTETDEAAE